MKLTLFMYLASAGVWRRLFVTVAFTIALVFRAGSVRAAELPKAKHRFVVIAHRADHTQAHENTITAIENAIKIGADYVEVDLRETKDGHQIIMHDSTVDRKTDGKGKVAEMTIEKIRKLKVINKNRPDLAPDKVPTFEEVLECIKGRINLYLDFKEGDKRKATAAIRKAGVASQVIVYDDLDSVREWREVAPELPLICSPPSNEMSPAKIARVHEKYGIEILDGAWKGYTAEIVRAAQKSGMVVWPDVQGGDEGPDLWQTAVAFGITGAQTDKPGEFITWLEKRHLR